MDTSVRIPDDRVIVGRPTLQHEIYAIALILGRYRRVILMCGVIGLVLAFGYCLVAKPVYRAEAQLSLDPRRMAAAAPVDAQSKRREDPLIDTGRADSEAEILKSERVLRRAVVALNLQNNPDYVDRMSVARRIKGWLGLNDETPLTEEDRIALCMAIVGKALKIERVDKSYVINITTDAATPELSAQLANAIAAAYISSTMDAGVEVTKASTAWLKAQLAQLAKDASAAEAAAVSFRGSNNILTSDGKLVDEQTLSSLSDQLSQAIQNRADAAARLERVSHLDADSPEILVSDVFKNDVITKLRTQYIENENKATSLAARYGENHEAVVKLRTDNQAIAAGIRSEIERYKESYRSDYEIAVGREKKLRDDLDAQFHKTVQVGGAQVRANDLDSKARALRTAYETAMQRFTDTVAKVTFPVSEALVISHAIPSPEPASPKRLLVSAGGLVGGLMLGFAWAFGTELTNRKVRTRRDAEEVAGVPCFGYIPQYGTEPAHIRQRRRDRLSSTLRNALKPTRLPLDFVLQHPFSITAETLRVAKLSMDLATPQDTHHVVACVSPLPHAGKTTVAVNFAHLLSASGFPTLLIDCDLRNPGLSLRLAPDVPRGLPDALTGQLPFEAIVRRLHNSPVDIVPVSPKNPATAPSSDLLGSTRMKAVLDHARQRYRYIVLDLPPVLSIVDVRAISRWVDSFIMVIDWQHTSRDAVADAIQSAPDVEQKLIGSVLNKAMIRSLKSYGEHVDAYYVGSYFRG